MMRYPIAAKDGWSQVTGARNYWERPLLGGRAKKCSRQAVEEFALGCTSSSRGEIVTQEGPRFIRAKWQNRLES